MGAAGLSPADSGGDALLPDGGRGDVVIRLGGENHRGAPGAPGDQHLLEHLGRVGAAHQDRT